MNPVFLFKVNDFISRSLRFFFMSGFALMGKKRFIKGYSVVFPLANYSPWEDDEEFQKAYSDVKDYTLVDKYRLWELWSIIRQAPPGGVMVEVGCWRGGSSALTCLSNQLNEYGGDNKMYAFDTFKGVVNAGRYDPDYHDGDHKDAKISDVHEVFNKLGLVDKKHYEVHQGVFPDETGKILEGKKISFIHMDLDVFVSTRESINYLWGKLLSGGIVVFDDYGFEACKGVTKYVNDQLNRDDMIIIHNLNGHAIIIKK